MSLDIFRPIIHFTPEKGWMNDPNGMIWFNGLYHLYYQYYPNGIKWGAMHWGHASSEDLINWKHHPIALFPDKKGTIFSGTIIYSPGFDKSKQLIAFFTHFKFGLQRQSIALSNDTINWEKYINNPILKNPGIIHFRDPKVLWYPDQEKWIMLLACGKHIRFYDSKDLISWKYLSSFGRNDGEHGGIWECPDLLCFNNSDWVLLVSIKNGAPNGGNGMQYFVGYFDGKRFINSNPAETKLWLDYGTDCYAGLTWSNIPSSEKKPIFIAWMSNWQYASKIPTSPWRGTMTIARSLDLKTINNKKVLCSLPYYSIEKYQKPFLNENNFPLSNQIQYFLPTKTTSCDISLIIKDIVSKHFVLQLRNEIEDSITIEFDFFNAMLTLDRSNSGKINFSRHFPNKIKMPINSSLIDANIRILIDSCSIELFINDGESTLTCLVFPKSPYSHLIINPFQKIFFNTFVINSIEV